MAGNPILNRSDSTASKDSSVSAASFTSADLNVDEEYSEAPWDIYGEHEGIGRIKIATRGSSLPLITGYKTKKDGTATVGVQFRITKTLKVEIEKVKIFNAAEKLKINSRFIHTPQKQTPVVSNNEDEALNSNTNRIDVAEECNDEYTNIAFLAQEENNAALVQDKSFDTVKGSDPLVHGIRNIAKDDWLSQFKSNFHTIVLNGLKAALRPSVSKKFSDHEQLNAAENQAVICAVCYHIFEYIGRQRPEKDLCRDVAAILKHKLPETYGRVETVESVSFGSLPVKKNKGEGGLCSLPTRISNQSYNDYIRPFIKRPAANEVDPVASDCSSKKPRKFYAVNPEKWYYGSKATKAEYNQSKAEFMLMNASKHDKDAYDGILDSGRIFLQAEFRNQDPSTHIAKIKEFWSKPQGLLLLSNHFEWLVDGSDGGNLSLNIKANIDRAIGITVQVLSNKKDRKWKETLDEVKVTAQARNGNAIMYYVYVIRELAKYWKNSPEKVIFIQGEDDTVQVSDQPYLHIVKIDNFGEDGFEEAILISVKVGAVTLFDNVSLVDGLAAVIQVCFVFHLLFPKDADETFNFIQHVLAKFGPRDGANNMKGQLKKKFIDFQCALADIVLMEEEDVVKKMNSIASLNSVSQPLKVKKSVKCKDGQFVSFAPQEVSPYEQMREEHINHLHNTIIKLKRIIWWNLVDIYSHRIDNIKERDEMLAKLGLVEDATG